MNNRPVWTVTHYGWAAFVNGCRLSIRKYRRGDGDGFVYVARINESALRSPAVAHLSLASAKVEAELAALTRRTA